MVDFAFCQSESDRAASKKSQPFHVSLDKVALPVPSMDWKQIWPELADQEGVV